MSRKPKARILKPKRLLSKLLEDGQQFFVGLPYADYYNLNILDKYNLPKNFRPGHVFRPSAVGTTTKTNIKGKFVRKKPEEKKVRTVHISYIRKDGTKVEYDRDFNAYVKELQHLYGIDFHFDQNAHGVQHVLSPLLTFSDAEEDEMKNAHIINLFLEIFSDFEIYTADIEPAIGINKEFDFEILPKGEFKDDDVKQIVEGVRTAINADEARALQHRLQVIKEYNPDLRGRGPAGFFGYIVFGFKSKGFVVVESMYLGNATYIFDLSNYEEHIAKDKQEILSKKLYKMRIYHFAEWEKRIRSLLQ